MLLFTNPSERAAYFRDTRSANPGDALRHARVVNLGIWGNEALLFEDTARILLREMRTVFDSMGMALKCVEHDEIRWKHNVFTCTDIMQEPTFSLAYRQARWVAEEELAKALESITDENISPDLKREIQRMKGEKVLRHSHRFAVLLDVPEDIVVQEDRTPAYPDHQVVFRVMAALHILT